MLALFNMFKMQTCKTISKAAVTAALLLFFIFLGSFTCSKNYKLRSVGLFYSYPLSSYKEKDTVKIYNFKDTIFIFYYSDYILYRLSPTVKFETGEKINGTEPYFIYNKKGNSGFLFSSLKDSSQGIKFPVDSFLANRGMRSKDFDVPPDSLWFLAEVVKDKEKSVIEKYAVVKPGNETSIDSIYYYYAKNKNDIKYTFSKKLDSIKMMKLFKIRMLYNSKFSTANKITLPKREIFFEIRDEIVSNPEEIISFIDKFEKSKTNQ